MGGCDLTVLVEEGLGGEADEHGDVLIAGSNDYGREVGWADFVGPGEGFLHRGNCGDGFLSKKFDGAGGEHDDGEVFVFQGRDEVGYGRCVGSQTSQCIGGLDANGGRWVGLDGTHQDALSLDA